MGTLAKLSHNPKGSPNYVSVAFMYPVVILENKVLRATAKTHEIAVFKNHHTEIGESITLSEF